MLRTMVSDTPFEQKWVLQGRLCGPWALDLEQRWNAALNQRQGRKCVVNLDDVTYMDGWGERLLRQMLDGGCELEAHRAYVKSILATLKADRSYDHVDR